MSDTPPVLGQDPWGADLNTYLASLEARVVALESKSEWLYNSTSYQFSNQAPPATGSQIRLNNVNAPLATLIDARLIDSDGSDRSHWFRALTIGSRLRILDWDNATLFHIFNVTGLATLDATNAQVPVTWREGNGVIPNAKVNVGFLVKFTE